MDELEFHSAPSCLPHSVLSGASYISSPLTAARMGAGCFYNVMFPLARPLRSPRSSSPWWASSLPRPRRSKSPCRSFPGALENNWNNGRDPVALFYGPGSPIYFKVNRPYFIKIQQSAEFSFPLWRSTTASSLCMLLLNSILHNHLTLGHFIARMSNKARFSSK